MRRHALRVPGIIPTLLILGLTAGCEGQSGPPGPRGERGPAGPSAAASVSAGTGLRGAPGAESGTLSLSIDPNVVPQLGEANVFSGVNAFSNPDNMFSGNGYKLTALNASNLVGGTVPPQVLSGDYYGITRVGLLQGLGVEGGVVIRGEVDVARNIIQRMVPGIAMTTASFQGTSDTATNASISKQDGLLLLRTTAQAGAVGDVRSNIAYRDFHLEPGDFLAVRAGFFGLKANGHTAYVMRGAPTGNTWGNAGGFGFRAAHDGTSLQLSGVTFDNAGKLVNSVALGSTPGGKLLAVYRGEDIAFFVNGRLAGTVPTTGMNEYPVNYSVRLENNGAAQAAEAWVGYLTLGSQLF